MGPFSTQPYDQHFVSHTGQEKDLCSINSCRGAHAQFLQCARKADDLLNVQLGLMSVLLFLSHSDASPCSLFAKGDDKSCQITSGRLEWWHLTFLSTHQAFSTLSLSGPFLVFSLFYIYIYPETKSSAIIKVIMSNSDEAASEQRVEHGMTWLSFFFFFSATKSKSNAKG